MSASDQPIVMPPTLDAWIEGGEGPVILLIQPSMRGVMGQSSCTEGLYAKHARYFASEDEAVEWYEANKPKLRSCLVARYPIVDGRSA